MIVYLNQRNYTQSKYIERQKEFVLNFFRSNVHLRGAGGIKPVTSTAPRIRGRVGTGDLQGGTITPVIPKTNNVNVPGTGVKVNGNMPIQSQAQQFLDSGQVQAAQRNAATPSRNPNNKKFQKQNQILNTVPGMNEIANAGGNTLVIGAKDTRDITAAVNNANNGVVGRVKGGINGDKIINQNAYQGQVAIKEMPKQQGTGATAADIKQAKITQDKFNRFQQSQTAQQALKDRLATAKSNGTLQNYRQQRQVNADTEVSAQDASRNTKLPVKVNKPAAEAPSAAEASRNTKLPVKVNKPAAEAPSAAEASRNTKLPVKVDNPRPETATPQTPPPYKPQGQSQPQTPQPQTPPPYKPQGQPQGQGQNQQQTPPPYKPQGQGQQQTPPPYKPQGQGQQQTPPANNTQGQGQNNQQQTPSTNTNQGNWDKLDWWDKWGKQSAIGLGTGAAAIGATYGIKSMLGDDDDK
jgi:hypothetical protein